MQEKIIDSKVNGFRDVFFSNGWRVSYADYASGTNDADSIYKMEKHLETEEAFYLLKGQADLITAGKGHAIGLLEGKNLKTSTLYVVERGEWHVVAFKPGSSVLIIENELDSLSESVNLSKLDLDTIKKILT
ncbi:MAG: hypothetical protein PQJ48_09000 [Sphaerochaetaceae bacterium]|nr:hypothetical protein [Sphaerochaetaceae bacterium]